MSSKRLMVGAAVGAATLWAGATPAAAGPTYLSQLYRVSADAGLEQEVDELTGPGSTVVEADDTNEEVFIRARTTADIDADDDGVRIAGDLDVVVEPIMGEPSVGSGSSTVVSAEVDFSLDVAHAYTLAASRDILFNTGSVSPGQSYAILRGLEPSTQEIVFSSEEDETATGTLEAGEYQFRFLTRAFTVPGASTDGPFGTFQSGYELDFSLSPVDGGGGGEPNPIPLPPAVWSGLAALSLVALPYLRKRRHG